MASIPQKEGPKWIEFIRVRSSPATLAAAAQDLHRSLAQDGLHALGAEVMYFQHALYDGDLAVILVWPNRDPPQRTHLGLMLAEQLEKLGSIEHAVWVPTPSPQPDKRGQENVRRTHLRHDDQTR
ncbi:MAG: hypothetical protein B7733_03310 [Myxococcales bacterium FL481]|nr:MAG: hypothetical protein B7733_03310 [Myxococcales bacterium FL481]